MNTRCHDCNGEGWVLCRCGQCAPGTTTECLTCDATGDLRNAYHAPVIRGVERTGLLTIVQCACGFTAPPGEDAEDVVVAHVAYFRASK